MGAKSRQIWLWVSVMLSSICVTWASELTHMSFRFLNFKVGQLETPQRIPWEFHEMVFSLMMILLREGQLLYVSIGHHSLCWNTWSDTSILAHSFWVVAPWLFGLQAESSWKKGVAEERCSHPYIQKTDSRGQRVQRKSPGAKIYLSASCFHGQHRQIHKHDLLIP